jgi:hypothetical protein
MGQDTIVGTLISKDGHGVPYANIACLNSTYGATADSIGQFTLPIKSINDQFKISSIGFKSQAVSAFDLSKDTIVLMDPIIIELSAVETISSAKKFKNKTIGWPLRKSNYYITSLPGNHFSTKLDCPKDWEGCYIESVQFLIAKMGCNHSPIRVRILKVNTANMPGDDILLENKIVSNYSSETYETITVDLKSHGIKIPKEGIFVSIEWLDVWNETASGILSFLCTSDHINANKNSQKKLPSPAIAMSRNKAPFSLQNYRDRKWYPMSSNCRLNITATLRKIKD